MIIQKETKNNENKKDDNNKKNNDNQRNIDEKIIDDLSKINSNNKKDEQKNEQEEIEKRLKNIQEKLYFCSRCGICKEICPSFNLILSESFSARGRIISITNEVFDKKLFYNCSLCGACEEICPSDIDLVDIFREIREIFVIKKDEIDENKKMIENFKKNDVPFDIDKKEQDDFYCC